MLELLFALALGQELLDLARHFGERRRPRAAPLEHLDDVKAERRLDEPLVAPGFSLNAASSNAGVIWPFGKKPRSPPFCALPVS